MSVLLRAGFSMSNSHWLAKLVWPIWGSCLDGGIWWPCVTQRIVSLFPTSQSNQDRKEIRVFCFELAWLQQLPKSSQSWQLNYFISFHRLFHFRYGHKAVKLWIHFFFPKMDDLLRWTSSSYLKQLV